MAPELSTTLVPGAGALAAAAQDALGALEAGWLRPLLLAGWVALALVALPAGAALVERLKRAGRARRGR